MQHSGILGMKAIQSLRQKPDDLAFGNLDTDIVEQGCQSLRRDLPMGVKHQAEASQIGPKATLDSCRQRRDNRSAIRRHPAFAAIPHHVDPHDQIPHDAILVTLEARSRWRVGRQQLFARDVARVAFRPAAARRFLPACNRFFTRCLFHARRPERWAWRQVFKPRNLVAQKLVIDLQPGVLDPELVVLSTKLLVFGLELFDPDVCPISPLYQTRHQLSQRLQRQRVGMLDHGKAALRHEGSES